MKPGSLLIPIVLIVLTVIGCSKNSGGKPSLSLESINTTVQPNDSMRSMFKFSSGGALGNGSFGSIRIRLNQLPATNPSGGDTILTPIPSFSGSNGEFRYALPWQGYLSETAGQNDTVIFKFWVLTADSVSSDTVTSPKVVILNP